MTEWKEVSPYTGQDIDEDAPANNAGSGDVSMPPDAVMDKKKKKQELIDGRTKAYKEHRRRLEASRQRRIEAMQKKESAFAEKILSPMRKFSVDEKL